MRDQISYNTLLERVLRKLPNFKGKRRVAQTLFANKLRSGNDVLIKGSYNCWYNLPNLKEYLALEIFVNGIYESETHGLLSRLIPKGGTFLDLGANIGSIAIPLCKLRSDVKCVAVEAAPWIFDYLVRNVERNELNSITCINKAIADTEGPPLPFYCPTEQFGKGSLAPVFSDSSVLVERTTIDRLAADLKLKKVDTIKIDIEGFEFFAFKGGLELLSSSNAPDVVFEFVDWAEDMAGKEKGSSQALLLNAGYELFTFAKGSLIQMNDLIKQGDAMILATKRPHQFK